MERLQVAMEKIGGGSKRSTTLVVLLLVVCLLVTVMYQASPNYLTFIKANDLEQETTTTALEHKHNNVTSVSTANNTVRGPPPAPSDVGSGNLSLSGWLKNMPSQSSTREPNNGVLDHVGSESASSLGSENKTSNPGTSTPNAVLDDGLLAPGWDQGSCISRHQSHLYRRHKSSPYKPPEFLISKLRDYEHLHRRCGPQSNSYRKAMRGLVKSGKPNGTTTDCNYTVWLHSNGLGNRMLSIVAGFLWSVLTDRVLLVDFHRDMIGLFCEPFLNSTWMLPRDFPHKGKHMHLPTYESLLNSSDQSEAPQFLFLRLSHGNEDHVRFFHCNRSQSLLRKVPVVVLESDQYFVPSLFMEEFFKEKLTSMFTEKGSVFHLLGKYLFHPSNEAWGLITRFYQAYLSEAEYRIGLQIRVFNSDTANRTHVMEGISSCTSKNKLLPEVGDSELTSSPHRNTSSSTAVLVASLYPEFAENLRNVYWTRPTVTGETVSVHQPSHDGHQKFNDRTQNLQAWAEIYLLSLSDELVTSAQSTFGYVAHSLGGIRPWILPQYLNKDTGRNCQRVISMEPCNHFPPRLDCQTMSKLDIPSRFPYMMACEDFTFGVKMVDPELA